jgi:hypothetical protein
MKRNSKLLTLASGILWWAAVFFAGVIAGFVFACLYHAFAVR